MVGEFNKNRDIHPKVEALTGLSDTATELKLRIEELESVFDKSSNPIEQKGILKECSLLPRHR